MDHDKFVQLLESVLAPDTSRVKAATATLKKDYYPSPESLALLIQLLTSHESPQLRQLAATQARSLVPKHWPVVPSNHKPQIRTHLLQATLGEKNSLARHAQARVISAVAKIDIEDGEWTELPALMQQAATSQTPQEREVGTYILFTILESMGGGVSQNFGKLFELFSQTIHDPASAEVRINTMLALGKIGMVLDADDDEESLEAFQKALPDMVSILKQAIEAGDEDRTTQAFEIFQTLLECDSRLLSVHFRDLVQFMMQLASEKSLDKEARIQALNFLINCVLYRKTKFQGLRIGEQLTVNLMDILAESGDDTDDDDGFSLAILVLSLLSMMAQNLPPSQTMVPLIRTFKTFATSSNYRQRSAGITALGTAAEGAGEFLDTQLPDLIPLILQLLMDPEAKVRGATANGTKLLGDVLPETLGKEHEKFISALVRCLNQAVKDLDGPDSKANLKIVPACVGAIDSLVEGLASKDIEPYLPGLVPHLSHLFSHEDPKIKQAAIGAVGSIAENAKDAFLPYFERSMNALSEFVHIKDNDDELDTRCMTMDAMGSMASAVGAEPFQRYVRPLMDATEEGIQLDNNRLKESCYLLWGTLAKVYGPDFKPFLPGVVQALFKCLEEEDDGINVELGEEAADLVGKEVMIGGQKVRVVGNSDTDGIADMDDLDDMDDDGDSDWDDLAGFSSIVEEQEVAVEVVADLLAYTKGEFLPYLARSIELILPMVENGYEGSRRSAISTLYRAYVVLWQLQDEQHQEWQPGLPLRVQPTDDVMKLGDAVMKSTLEIWSEELEGGVLIEINRSVAEVLRLCGPAIISGPKVLEQVAEIQLSILKKQHTCQIEDAEASDDEGMPEEISEDDWYIVDSALDTITTLAAALGDQYSVLWKQFEKPVMQYASSSEAGQRSAAVGTIADSIRGMKQAVTPSTPSLLKLLLHRMSDEDALTKSNAAFAIGLLIEFSNNEKDIKRAYNTVFTKLEPLLHTPESRQLDNAAGCVSRMILKHQDIVPVDEVLPALVALLPLKEDYEENEPIFRMIVHLCVLDSSGEPTMLRLTPRLLPVLAQVMGPPESQLTEGSREALSQLVKYVYHNQAAMLQGYPSLLQIASS